MLFRFLNFPAIYFTSAFEFFPEYNKRMLKERVPEVKGILGYFSYPYNRRIAGQHGHFTMEDYRKWLKKAETEELARALRRLAQLNQTKVYLFWKGQKSSILMEKRKNGMFTLFDSPSFGNLDQYKDYKCYVSIPAGAPILTSFVKS